MKHVPCPALERPFADKLLCIFVSPDAESFPLADFARFICERTNGVVIQKLGAIGVDEVYWDIQAGAETLVLHTQHYLGVFLCAGSRDAEPTIETLFPVVQAYVTGPPGVPRWVWSVWRTLRSAWGS